MSKKFFLIFYNCMGNSIKKQLIQSKQFINIYNIIYISLYDYLEGYKYGNKNQLINEHIDLLSKADLLIVQSLRKNRNHLNFDNIIKFIKKNAFQLKYHNILFQDTIIHIIF